VIENLHPDCRGRRLEPSRPRTPPEHDSQLLALSHCLPPTPVVTLSATALREGAVFMVGQTILVKDLVFKTRVVILIKISKGGD